MKVAVGLRRVAAGKRTSGRRAAQIAKTRVKLEILLLCLGYNLNKLHAKIQSERTGSHLFEVKSA